MLDLFKDFILNRISIEEFEDIVYQKKELEESIGQAIYLDLISFNYQSKSAYYELMKLLEEKVILENDLQHWKIRNIFSKHGWYEGRKFNLESFDYSDTEAQRIAVIILEEFGGLEIEPESDSKYDFRDVIFFKAPYVEISKKLGHLAYFASTQRSYAHVCVDNKGVYYIYYEMTHELHLLGTEFDDSIAAILFNLESGKLVEIVENHEFVRKSWLHWVWNKIGKFIVLNNKD